MKQKAYLCGEFATNGNSKELMADSIKAKSNEYARDYLFSPEAYKGPSDHFEAGGNYVLDAVEEILKDEDLNSEKKCNKLFAFVQQLKK